MRLGETERWIVYLVLGILLLLVSIVFLLWSLSYMEQGYVATSLLAATIGFTTFSGSLYILRLSAYVYGASMKEKEKAQSGG